MSSYNEGTISPNLPFPERGRVVVDVQLAQNTRRKGQSYAQEGLGSQQRYHGSFYEAVRDSDTGASHTDVEVQIAGQANGRSLLASGQLVPAWNAVDAQTRQGFLDGTSGEEISMNPQPFMHRPRPGANASPLGPTFGFNADSKPNTVYQTKIAPPRGGRHRNEADV
jgi:hypothetical protein